MRKLERINKPPLIDHVTIKIKKVDGLLNEESSVLISAFREEEKAWYGKGDIVKCRIYYDNQLIINEF